MLRRLSRRIVKNTSKGLGPHVAGLASISGVILKSTFTDNTQSLSQLPSRPFTAFLYDTTPALKVVPCSMPDQGNSDSPPPVGH